MQENIKKLLEEKNYAQLYEVCPDVLNEMLAVESREEYEDFIEQEGEIDAEVFELFYGASIGESVMVDAFEGDVTAKVNKFFIQKLQNSISEMIRRQILNWYVNIDEYENLQENVEWCNKLLMDLGYAITLKFDDTYCAGVYFIFVS